MICPSGHGQKPGKFCSDCGAELVAELIEDPSDPSYKIMGDIPCHGCGYSLKHAHQRFCPGCGHQLTWLCR